MGSFEDHLVEVVGAKILVALKQIEGQKVVDPQDVEAPGDRLNDVAQEFVLPHVEAVHQYFDESAIFQH